MQVLHLDSSIQGELSVSRAITAEVVNQLSVADPDVTVMRRDLVEEPLSHLTLEALGDAGAQRVLEEFLASEIVVIGAGMYNFTIPSQLKAWIDRILVAGKTFSYGAEGPQGLVGNKRVVVVLARGGLFGEGAPFAPLEYAETYLRGVLAFIGITAPEFVIAEGLALGDEVRKVAISAAIERARAVGWSFAQAA
jgi:FMN-dependent NADH-azoreductase